MGIISFAISIPFTVVLVEAFVRSNEPDYPDLQLSWPLLYRVMGRQTWHFAVRAGGLSGAEGCCWAEFRLCGGI